MVRRLSAVLLLLISGTAAGACTWDYPIWIPRTKSADALYRFERNGRAGYIDASGKIVVEPVLPLLGNRGAEFFGGTVRIGGLVGRLDQSGRFSVADGAPEPAAPPEPAKVAVLQPCLYFPENPCGASNPVRIGGGAGAAPTCQFSLLDARGRVVPGGPFDDVREFSDGLAPVRRAGRWGFIGLDGALVIPFRFEEAFSFSEGLARVRLGGSYGFIDPSGAWIVPPWFASAGDFAAGLAPVSNEEEGYWYINHRGESAIPGRFAMASPFFKGLAHVQLLDAGPEGEPEISERFAYIDRTGREVFRYAPGNYSPNTSTPGR